MERMTKRLQSGKAVMDCPKCEHSKITECTLYGCRNRLKDRLAAYEDTGLTPEEIQAPFTAGTLADMAAHALGLEPRRLRELAAADKDGRCIVLPCKAGDTIYMIRRALNADHIARDEIVIRKVMGYSGNAINKVWLTVNECAYNLSIFPSEFGKTVFLTREEAERALRGKEND